MPSRPFVYLLIVVLIVVPCIVVADEPAVAPTAQPEAEVVSAVDQMKAEAAAMEPLVTSSAAKSFLGAVANLSTIDTRKVHLAKGEALTDEAFSALPDDKKDGYKTVEVTDQFYFFTRYGTPVAFVRPVEVVGLQGFPGFGGAKVVDFGFGSIGQLHMMASLGADAHGIEVDPILEAIYSHDGDTGKFGPGSVTLHFGYFPGDKDMVAALGGNFDVFISKNTLKKGYIHPEREADKRMLIDLGVSDAEFVGVVHTMLKSGGLFLIYNLHPPMSKPEEEFVPWSDGRSPFTRETFEAGGFEVIEFDKDDTENARAMGRAFGWDEDMDLETSIEATYTLVKKK